MLAALVGVVHVTHPLHTQAIQDVHTARWVVEKCFKSDLLRGRTVLLVVCPSVTSNGAFSSALQTHNIAIAGSLADFVVSLDTDGHIISQGSVSDAIAKDSKMAEEIKHEEEAVELDEIEETAMTEVRGDNKGKLVVAEEIAIGRVSWKACECLVLQSRLSCAQLLAPH